MAGMLCLDYIQREYEFVFVRRSISEASDIWQAGLNRPYEYWEIVCKSLSSTAQMLLLAMAITEEPIFDQMIVKTLIRNPAAWVTEKPVCLSL